MKNWLYFVIAALFSFGFQSCYDDEFEEVMQKEQENANKLDELASAQEELKQKQNELNKLQQELNELLETLAQQDSSAVSNEQLLSEIKKMQEKIVKLQEELGKYEEVEPADTASTIITPSGSVNKYDNPEWIAVTADGNYAYSMTVVFQLPSALKDSATADDMLAAFVGEECRAVATLSNGVFFLDVIGTGEEESDVTFLYWNAGNHNMYESLVSLPFSADFIYGVVDKPKTFSCKQK